jgi:hypothetical protein
MKNLKIVLFSLLMPALLQPAFGAEKNYSLALSKPGEPVSLEIEVHTGAIYIEGYDGETVEVSAKVEDITDHHNSKMEKKISGKLDQHYAKNKSKARSSEGLKSVKNNMMQLEIEEEDNEIEISSEYSTKNVILHIKVPMRTSLDIELYQGGDVEISNIAGAIEAEAFKGSIIANGVSGPMVAETHNTDIVVSFDKLNQQNPTSLTSHSGNIDISVSKNTAAKINVQSYKGEILSGLATEFNATEDVQRNNNGGKQKIVIGGMMSAEVNGGGQDITLVTYNGNVYVRNH